MEPFLPGLKGVLEMALRIRKSIEFLLILFMLIVPTGAAYAFGQEQPALSTPEHGITFALERVTELKKGYLFEGTVTWTDPNIRWHDPCGVRLTDGRGRVLPLKKVYVQDSGDEMQSRWAFRSLKKSHAFPLTLTIDSYSFSLATEAPFSIDLGDNPQPGQTWPLDLDLQVAGYPLHIDAATRVDNPDRPYPYLELSLTADQHVYAVSVDDSQNPPPLGGGGQICGEWGPEPITAMVSYRNGFPSGVRELSVRGLDITINDPWQVTWQP